MSEQENTRPVTIEAAIALVEWKFQFASKVAAEAQRLASSAEGNATVTLAHYRAAAQLAVASLLETILADDSGHGQKAA